MADGDYGMGGLALVEPSDPVLWKATPEHTGDPRDLRDLAKGMFDLMAATGNGIGLAAPQVGESVRMFVMFLGRRYTCINPKVLQTKGDLVEALEGCLTRPGEQFPVTRSENILVEYTDLYGQTTQRWLYGLTARCFQHEMDHLDGKCIFPH